MKNYTPYPKRDAIKNYFPLPNEVFSLGLTPGEISVYCYLMYRENRETHPCHPSYKTIGKALQMSTNTVKKYVDSLWKYFMDLEGKQRISLYLDKNLIRNADVAMKKYGYRSRNEFYTKAIENLIADILLEDNKTSMSEKLAQAIAAASKDNATTIAKGLFRYAVQLEMVMRMLADQFDYKPSDVGLMRQEAINNVRRTRGKVSLEDIITGYYTE